MSRCDVVLSSNAGASVTWNGVRILIDVFHGPCGDYAPMPEETWDHPDFQAPAGILYTHHHPDHFDLSMARRARQVYPDAVTAAPEPVLEGQIVLREQGTFSIGPVTVTYRQLPHIASRQPIAHTGYLLEDDGSRILVTGDCMLPCRELEELLQGKGADLALLNWPWIATPRRRQYVQEVIRPDRMLLFHFPSTGEDVTRSRERARASAEACTKIPYIDLLTDPFQKCSLQMG